MGSDGSAAGGRKSDLSEWPRSADEEGAPSPTKMPGYRNRGAMGALPGRCRAMTNMLVRVCLWTPSAKGQYFEVIKWRKQFRKRVLRLLSA